MFCVCTIVYNGPRPGRAAQLCVLPVTCYSYAHSVPKYTLASPQRAAGTVSVTHIAAQCNKPSAVLTIEAAATGPCYELPSTVLKFNSTKRATLHQVDCPCFIGRTGLHNMQGSPATERDAVTHDTQTSFQEFASLKKRTWCDKASPTW